MGVQSPEGQNPDVARTLCAMAGLDPSTSAQLQALLNQNRAPAAGTWASPETAPLPAPMAAPAPEAITAPITAPAVMPSSPVQAQASPAPPVPAPVDLPPAPVQEPLPAPPRNFEEAQARTIQATDNYGDAVRDEGEAKARSAAAEAEVFERQAQEQLSAEQAFKRDQDERKADVDEVRAQLTLMQQKNSQLNQITDRRTTTQKVMGTIAQALASVGDGLSRLGGNTHTDYSGAMTAQLNAQIEQDIARQKEAIEGRNKDVAMKLTELGQAKAALGEGEDAERFFIAQRQLRYAAELKSQAARSGSELAKSEMLTAAAKLEADAALHQETLVERLTEQKYRSRQIGKTGGGAGGGALDLASIRATVENGGQLTPAQFKAAKDMGLFKDKSSSDPKVAELEALEASGDITAKQQKVLSDLRKSTAEKPEKDDTADQAKARMLFDGSARPAAALEARMKSGKFPATTRSIAEKLGIAPDVWNKEATLFAQETESVGNDLLRYESGASISTQETEGLLKRARSTDPDIRTAAVQRLLDKRAALGRAFKQRPAPSEGAASSKSSGSTVVKETKPVAGGVRVRWPATGTVYNLPPDAAESMIKNGGVRL